MLNMKKSSRRFSVSLSIAMVFGHILAGAASAGPFDDSHASCRENDPGGECTMITGYTGDPVTMREFYDMNKDMTKIPSMINFYRDVTIEHIRCVNGWDADDVDWDTIIPLDRLFKTGYWACSR